jgi:FkbM family methyltransferase
MKIKILSFFIKLFFPLLKTLRKDLYRRIKILEHHKINLVIDVGANKGQYSELLMLLGYDDKIISFEPLNDAYQKLKHKSEKKTQWVAQNYALGEGNYTSKINISKNSVSSSLLGMEQKHLDIAPNSQYIDEQVIEVKTLDSVFYDFYKKSNNVLLKIDTQGYEKNVLDGAQNVLEKVDLIQIEMSLVKMYNDELIYTEIIDYLDKKGFKIISLEPGFYNAKTGELMQVDGIFLNKNKIKT